MKVVFAADHAGFELKNTLKDFVETLGYETEDVGAFSYDADDDYPDFMKKAARVVAADPETTRGILLGGSGEGEAMVANRFAGVRAAVFYGGVVPKTEVDIVLRKSNDPYEITRLSREHNDANILTIGARFISEEEVKEAVKVFLETPFNKEERHTRRIRNIDG